MACKYCNYISTRHDGEHVCGRLYDNNNMENDWRGYHMTARDRNSKDDYDYTAIWHFK